MPAPKNRPYTTPNNNIPAGSLKESKSAAPKKYPREFDTKRTAESFTADPNVRNPVASTNDMNIDPANAPTSSPVVRPKLKYATIHAAAYTKNATVHKK